MAIAQQYPLGTPKSSDLIISTSIPDPNTNDDPKTVNFSVSSIGSFLITSNDITTGSGTTNAIPVWTDGPNGVLGDSIITQDSLGGNVANVAGRLSVEGDLTVDNRALFDGQYARFLGEVQDRTTSPGASGQVLSSTGTNVQWVDPSSSITKLVPYFQLATPGGSDTYTESNNIVDFDWSGGSGTYEYILPSATDIPYRKIRFVNNSTVSANTKVHITAPGTETIDGGAFYEINKAYNGCAVWSDGVQWIVIQAKA